MSCRTTNLSRTLALCLAAASLQACNSRAAQAPAADPSEPAPADPGLATISLQLTAVPGDVRCVRALVTGHEMVIRSVDVAAGAGTQAVNFPALPLGPASVYFDAFNVACATVGPNTGPTWVAIEPTKMELIAGQVSKVSIELRRPTSIAGSLDFADSPPGVFLTPAHVEITRSVGGGGALVALSLHNTTATAFSSQPAIIAGDLNDFVMRGDGCLAGPVPPGGTCDIIVEFNPSSGGTKRAIVKSGGLYSTITGAAVDRSEVRFEPSAVDFGGVAIGQQKTLRLTLVNGSRAPFSTTFRQVDNLEFEIGGSTCRDELAIGDSCTIDVIYAPIFPGPSFANVIVGSVSARVTGTPVGSESQIVTFDPPGASLGNVVIGEQSSANFILRNGTTAPFSTALALTGLDYAFESNSCPAVLAPGATCNVGVSFRPTSPSAGFAILTAGPGSIFCYLQATVLVPRLTFTPASVDFGNVAVGQQVLKVVTVSTDMALRPSLSLFAPDVRIAFENCDQLASGQMCTIQLQYSPTAVGPTRGELKVNSWVPGVQVTGSGVLAGAVTLSPSTNVFASATVGKSSDVTLTLNNSTAATFSPAFTFAGPNAPEFLPVGGTCAATVAANASCTVVVRFSPSAVGARSATLTAGGQSNTVSLSGTGLAPVPSTISPSTFDFGSVSVGQVAKQTFTVTNNAATAFSTASTMSPSGELNVDGTAGTCLSAQLAPGASCTIVVRFQPGSVGAKQSTLVVGAGVVTAAVSGTGVATAPPITNLVVNDTAAGGDGIPNNQQWTVQANFRPGVAAFGDRTSTIQATGNGSLDGKTWIRTAGDSKLFAGTTLATFTLTGNTLFLLVDDRHNALDTHKPKWLDATYSDAGFDVTILDGTTPRPYSVWKKTVASGTSVALPAVNSATAPCYMVVVQ